MPYITGITAKIIILVEAILDNFVTLSATTTNLNGAGVFSCDGANVGVMQGTISACGTTLAGQLANLAVEGVTILNQLIPGILVKAV